MTRCLVILVALAACKGREAEEGVSKLLLKSMGMWNRSKSAKPSDSSGASFALHFTVRLPKVMDDSRGITVKAAAQVGMDRLVEVQQPTVKLEPDRAIDLDVPFFQENPLPADPSSYDFEISERGATTSKVIHRVCFSQGFVDGPCPPNIVPRSGVGPTGVTGVIDSVTRKEAASVEPHLVIGYRVTAHKDMPNGAYLARLTTCPGRRNDDTWTAELGLLRAGESLRLRASTPKLGVPEPGTSCETTLGYATSLGGELEEIAIACHTDTAVTPGPCRR